MKDWGAIVWFNIVMIFLILGALIFGSIQQDHHNNLRYEKLESSHIELQNAVIELQNIINNREVLE